MDMRLVIIIMIIGDLDLEINWNEISVQYDICRIL